MKKGLLIQSVVILVIFGFSATLYALPATVKLQFTGVDPSASGSVHFPSLGDVNVLYGQYNFNIDWDSDGTFDSTIGGYCVEDVYAPPRNIIYDYEVLDVYGNYKLAAYALANSGGLSAQASQLVVWEMVFDGIPSALDPLSQNSGDFYTNGSIAYMMEAQVFLNSIDWSGYSGFDGSGYKILRNPPGSGPGVEYQDYLVSVPDAALMFLLGPALIGLGLFGRRKRA
jgi:hypothetical protein